MKKFSSIVVFVSFVFFWIIASAAPSGSGYHLIKKIPLEAAAGGRENFDYITVDSAARRVYLSHGTEVKVLDADNFSVVGTITGLKRSRAIAIAPTLGKGFITDAESSNVVVFDTKSLKVTNQIKTYPDTSAMIYDPESRLIFTFNGDSENASVIDPAAERVVKTIDMGGDPEEPVADGKGMIYDNNEEKSDVAAIDTHTLTIKARWPIAPAGGAVALDMDRKNRRLFSSGRKPTTLVMMNADTGKVLQSLPISGGVGGNVFDPETNMLFVSTRDGKIHVFHEDTPDKLSEVETINSEYGAKSMAMDFKTHNLFLSTADFPARTLFHPNPDAISGTFRVLIYGR
jgi:DNA-binding beta-propeller fold protein YncE